MPCKIWMSRFPQISLVINRVLALNIFKRQRVPLRRKVHGCLLYFLGLSFRKAARLLGVSHEAVRKWWRALAAAFSPERKRRQSIAVDETKLKLGGRQIYVWAAIDTRRREVIAVGSSRGRSLLDAYLFMKRVMAACTAQPIVHVDGGPWYRWSVRRAGGRYRRTRGGTRNHIERWFRLLKGRTKAFYHNIPGKICKAGFANVDLFARAFAGFYNLLWRR